MVAPILKATAEPLRFTDSEYPVKEDIPSEIGALKENVIVVAVDVVVPDKTGEHGVDCDEET